MRAAETAAQFSHGLSSSELYRLAVSGLDEDLQQAKAVLDLGCGAGHFGRFLRHYYRQQLDGIDIVAYEDFPAATYDSFQVVNFDAASSGLASRSQYDLVFALEVIEHVENPRALVRFAMLFLKPNGKLILTTPNCLSLSSMCALVLQGQFRDFREGLGMYPSHITPVLPMDAGRIMQEHGLEVLSLVYSNRGRMPFRSRCYQTILPFLGGQLFSDNYRIVARQSDPRARSAD